MGFRTSMMKWEKRERLPYRGMAENWRAVGGQLGDGVVRAWCRMRAKLACERGQGTTEYAILVGVLVVIAIIAITVFRPKLEELWNAIADGINSL